MHDGDKTKEQMVNEMLQLRQQVAALEAAEAEHKRAEEDLKEHEENFKTLAENAADGIAIVTPEGTHVYVNKKAAAIAGYSVDELLHVNVKELLPSDEYRKLMKLFKKRLAGESQPSKYETTFIRKDGTQIPLEISVALTTWHGKPADIVFSRDITERKRAEEDLLESEEKYRELVERANDGITIIQDGIMRYINPRLAEIWGGTAQELRDTPFTDYIDPDELPIVVDRYNRRMKGEDVPSIYETVLRRKDGSKVYAELNAGSITYQGKFAHLVLVRNITERKQAEKELKESEERYRFLFENSQTINILIGTDGRILDVNESAVEALGYKKRNVLNKNVLDFIVPEQREDVEQQLAQELKGEYTPPLEIDIVTKKGIRTLLFTERHATLFEKGKLTGMLLSAVDITERKRMEQELRESEERFRTVVETMEVGLSAIDKHRVLTYVNEYFSKMLGYSVDEMIGRSTLDFYYDEEARKAQEEIFAKRRTGMRDPSPYEVTWRKKDGQKVYSILSPTPSFDADGRYTGSFAIHTDITERRKAEEELRKAERERTVILDSISEQVLYHDPHMKIQWANRAAGESVGLSPQQLVNCHCYEILHQRSEPCVGCPVVKALRTGRPEQNEITSPDGRMWFVRGYPVGNENGTVVGAVEVVLDISERHRAETALRESEERYRSLVESSEDSIYLVDGHCNYLFLNNRHLSRLGIPSDQIIGKAYREFNTPEESRDFAQRVTKVLETGNSLTYEYKSQRDNRYFIRTLSPVQSPGGGRPTALTVISKDITNLKSAEEALRESEAFRSGLLNDSPHPIIVINPDTSIRYVNPALENLTGFTAAKLIGRKTPYPWWIKGSVRKTREGLKKAIFKGAQRVEYRFHKKSGEDFWVEITAEPVMRDGEVRYLLTNWSDITERKRAEEALREREALNFALFQFNPVETIVVDCEGRVTGFNLAKQNSGGRLPTIGDLMYQDYAGRHEIDMRAELMRCIRLGKAKAFSERRYGDKFLSITITPFSQGALIISEDITERKRAADALRESEQFSSNLLNDSPYPILVINPDTSIRYINPALENLTGFSPVELIGKKAPYPWWPKETVRRSTMRLNKAIREGIQRVERNFQKKSGERFWVEITSIPTIRDGETQYLLTNWSNITERKQAEELLQKERDTFYSILDKAPYGVMVVEADGNHSFVNSEFTTITGYTLEDVPTTRDWLRQAYPDPHYRNMVSEISRDDFSRKEADEEFRKKFKRAFSRTLNVVCKNGVVKEIEFRRAELGDGATIAMLADITELKRMHELLEDAAAEWRTTFDAISDAVCLLNPEGKIMRCNNAMLELVQKPFSKITNHYCWEVTHGVSKEPPGCPVTRVGKTLHRETSVIPIDSRWFNVSVDPLLDEDNNYVGCVHIMSDITESKRVEDELQYSREQLRNLAVYLESVREQERTNIAREIHDELAQALTALKMDLSWLDHRFPPDQTSLFDKARSMHDLIDATIRTVKRISAELRPGILDDLGLIAALEWQAEEFQNRTGISCYLRVEPEDMTVDQDRSTALFRIFQETLTNVARHAHATKVIVDFKEEDGELMLRVEDNGRGITAEQISDPRSFGLIGMQERVYPWGGQVSIEGITGKGTTVVVTVGREKEKNLSV